MIAGDDRHGERLGRHAAAGIAGIDEGDAGRVVGGHGGARSCQDGHHKKDRS
jgi:hypothetical protein